MVDWEPPRKPRCLNRSPLLPAWESNAENSNQNGPGFRSQSTGNRSCSLDANCRLQERRAGLEPNWDSAVELEVVARVEDTVITEHLLIPEVSLDWHAVVVGVGAAHRQERFKGISPQAGHVSNIGADADAVVLRHGPSLDT